MKITGGSGRDFENPKPGQYSAVFHSFQDLGMQPGYQGGPEKEKIRVRWQLNELDSTGERFTVIKEYTKSLNEKSNLRKDLERVFGAFDAQDIKAGIDVEELCIGKPCFIEIDEKISKQGNEYTVVTSVNKPYPGMEEIELQRGSDDEIPF